MAKKSEWQFISFVLAVLIMGGMAFGSVIVGGDIISDFWKVFFLLIAIPLLVIFWWDMGVEISKKRVYGWCVFVVMAAAMTVWSLCSLKSERTIIHKAYSLMTPLWLLAVGLIPVIKYIKAQRWKQGKKNK